MQLNLGEIAECFGVEVPTVRQWIRKGAPIIQQGSKGIPWVIDPAGVSDWLREREREMAAGQIEKMDLDEARRRKLAAEAALVELDLAKKRGELVEIEEMVNIFASEYSAAKAKLLGLPTKLAAYAPANIRNELREKFDDGIRECLREINRAGTAKDSSSAAA